MAYASPRPAALEDRLLFLPSVATRWHVGAHQRYPPRRAAGCFGLRPPTKCCSFGPSVGQNDRKRGLRGYDAGKKVNGRKRHLLVDASGLLLTVVVHAADVQDRDGARLVLERAKDRLPNLRLIRADGGSAGQRETWVTTACGWFLEIIRRKRHSAGFQVLPRRWVAERTFAWLGKYRRRSKDDEALTETSEAFIYAAMVHLMVRRLARTPARGP